MLVFGGTLSTVLAFRCRVSKLPQLLDLETRSVVVAVAAAAAARSVAAVAAVVVVVAAVVVVGRAINGAAAVVECIVGCIGCFAVVAERSVVVHLFVTLRNRLGTRSFESVERTKRSSTDTTVNSNVRRWSTNSKGFHDLDDGREERAVDLFTLKIKMSVKSSCPSPSSSQIVHVVLRILLSNDRSFTSVHRRRGSSSTRFLFSLSFTLACNF